MAFALPTSLLVAGEIYDQDRGLSGSPEIIDEYLDFDGLTFAEGSIGLCSVEHFEVLDGDAGKASASETKGEASTPIS